MLSRHEVKIVTGKGNEYLTLSWIILGRRALLLRVFTCHTTITKRCCRPSIYPRTLDSRTLDFYSSYARNVYSKRRDKFVKHAIEGDNKNNNNYMCSHKIHVNVSVSVAHFELQLLQSTVRRSYLSAS